MFSVVRSPVNVPEADSAASVFMRSNICEMLFNPPSTICNCVRPLLAFWTPCVSSAMSARYWLATAKPAASSPEELMRKPEVSRWIVRLSNNWLTLRFCWAINEVTFVWIEIDIDEIS